MDAPTRPLREPAASLPLYTAGCYPVPVRFLYGTAAEINFWDVVYFRCYEGGGLFDTSTEELVEQTGLSRQMLGRLRRQALEWGELLEDVSWLSGRRFVLQVPGLEGLRQGVIWKPAGYVRNGWQHAVTPAIPKRVLNFYLQQPRQRVYTLYAACIAERCKRRFPHADYKPATPLNSADVGKALRLLVQLGLLLPEGSGFSIGWATFNQPAPLHAPPFDAPDLHQHPLFCEAASLDPARAERALELVQVGQYDMQTHFASIFRDLAYVREADYASIKAKAYRQRNRPPGPKRWRSTWQAFQYELKRRVAELRAPKQVLDLSDVTSAVCPLQLDLGQHAGRVLALRMVSRVEWPWSFEGEAAVHLELRQADKTLFARLVKVGDAEVRCSLQAASGPFVLHVQCERPLPGLHVEAWLEARLRK